MRSCLNDQFHLLSVANLRLQCMNPPPPRMHLKVSLPLYLPVYLYHFLPSLASPGNRVLHAIVPGEESDWHFTVSVGVCACVPDTDIQSFLSCSRADM